jgi:hypothetical protein
MAKPSVEPMTSRDDAGAGPETRGLVSATVPAMGGAAEAGEAPTAWLSFVASTESTQRTKSEQENALRKAW